MKRNIATCLCILIASSQSINAHETSPQKSVEAVSNFITRHKNSVAFACFAFVSFLIVKYLKNSKPVHNSTQVSQLPKANEDHELEEKIQEDEQQKNRLLRRSRKLSRSISRAQLEYEKIKQKSTDFFDKIRVERESAEQYIANFLAKEDKRVCQLLRIASLDDPFLVLGLTPKEATRKEIQKKVKAMIEIWAKDDYVVTSIKDAEIKCLRHLQEQIEMDIKF